MSYIIECETALYLTASMEEYESASGTIEGTSVCYCIHAENWAKMKQTLSEFLNQDLTPQNCC